MINRETGTLSVGMVFLILAVVGMLSAGQVLFKYAAQGLDFARPTTFFSLPLFAALFVYGIATLCWLLVLSRIPLSLAFPFNGLTFLLVPLLSWGVFREQLSVATIAGSMVIILGVVIITVGNR